MIIKAVVMASGNSRRFGENKLLYPVAGKPMISHLLQTLKASSVSRAVVVTKYEGVLALARECGIESVVNGDVTGDLSLTIRYGVEKTQEADGILLCVADQPYLTKESIDRLCALFREDPNCVCALSRNGEACNPVIFPKDLFDELLHLPPFSRGKEVLLRHKDRLRLCEVQNPRELLDIDEKSGLKEKI